MQSKKQPKPSFQDNLFAVFQTFWTAGYAYRHDKEKNSQLFLTNLYEDLMLMSQEEFIAKYKFYENQ